MRKTITFILCFAVFVVMCVSMTGCNKQLIDTTYTYERAIFTLPNGEIVDGEVESWTDYEDGDQIQVKINGKNYLVHSSDIVLISK